MQNTTTAPKTGTKFGKFLTESDRKALAKEQKQARAQKAVQHRNQIMIRASLVISNGIMIYMTLAEKIDNPFGVLFVAALSALLGFNMK